MAISDSKLAVIGGKKYHRFVFMVGGSANAKMAIAEGVRAKNTSLFESADFYGLDFGEEGFPTWVSPINLVEFGAKGAMYESLQKWEASGYLNRVSKSVVDAALEIAKADPARQLQDGAGATHQIALCGWERVREAVMGEVSYAFSARMAALKWPNVIIYVIAGVGGGTGRGIAPVFAKDLRVAIDAILERNNVKGKVKKQNAAIIVPIYFCGRAYAYQAFNEMGEETDRAELMESRTEEAFTHITQAVFVNGEVSHRAFDAVLRQSPDWMRRVVNAKADGYKPYALVSTRSQTSTQLIRLAAYAVKTGMYDLDEEPVSWEVKTVPDGIRATWASLRGSTDYEEKKTYLLKYRIPYKPDQLTADMTVAELVRAAAIYNRAKERYDEFIRLHGQSALNEKKSQELDIMIKDGLQAINTLVSRLRNAAGNSGLFMYTWEKKIFNGVLALRVKQIMAQNIEHVVGAIPGFDDEDYLEIHLTGNKDVTAIREPILTRRGTDLLLLEMGPKWKQQIQFRDDLAAMDAEELAQAAKEALAASDASASVAR